MVIRQEQMETLKREARELANRQLAVHAQQRFPEKFGGMPADELAAYCLDVRLRAKSAGFVWENHVRTWLELIVLHGEDFPTCAWAAPVLNDSSLTEQQKADALAALSEAQRDDA